MGVVVLVMLLVVSAVERWLVPRLEPLLGKHGPISASKLKTNRAKLTAKVRREAKEILAEVQQRILAYNVALERSPLNRADRIVRPLLIGQGANDVRVKPSESDQIVAAMRERGVPVTYVFYSDEGHGFGRVENRRSFTAVVEAFLAKHLGGRLEPVGDDFAGSTIDIKAGRDLIPGLG